MLITTAALEILGKQLCLPFAVVSSPSLLIKSMIAVGTEYREHFVENTLKLISKDPNNKVYQACREANAEVTLLINCLLGTVVTISESYYSQIPQGSIEQDFKLAALIPESVGFIDKIAASAFIKAYKISIVISNKTTLFVTDDYRDFTQSPSPIHFYGESGEIRNRSELIKTPLKGFIKNLRNGIAHQNIEPIMDSSVTEDGKRKWTGVKIWNEYPGTKDGANVKNFEIHLSIEELRELANHITSYMAIPNIEGE